MVVTKVQIESYTPKAEGVCAEATIVLDNVLVIHKVCVINGERGYFVALPHTGQTKIVNQHKRYEDLVHPINKTLSEEITKAVLSAFYNQSGKNQ